MWLNDLLASAEFGVVVKDSEYAVSCPVEFKED